MKMITSVVYISESTERRETDDTKNDTNYSVILFHDFLP